MKNRIHLSRANSSSRASKGVALVVSLHLLGGCGWLNSSDSNNASPAPAATEPTPAPAPATAAADPTVVPASAGTTVATFVAYLKSLTAAQDDTTEPLGTGALAAPVDDTVEPVASGS